ncbi:hypothetical protein M1R55_30660 (plasmid) [Deinococcus sp. QL22]|nr:hypothetical protein M1R55_30660 [Deinococcus sp. QL22]
MKQVPGEVVVVQGNAAIHRAKARSAFVETRERLTLVDVPPYSPELNPTFESLGVRQAQRARQVLCQDDQRTQGAAPFGWAAGAVDQPATTAHGDNSDLNRYQ